MKNKYPEKGKYAILVKKFATQMKIGGYTPAATVDAVRMEIWGRSRENNWK